MAGSARAGGPARSRRPSRPSRKTWPWFAGLALVLVAFGGLVAALAARGSGDDAQSPANQAAPAATRGAGAAGGPKGFAIVAYQGEEQLGGREVDFASLFGQGKPVVLNFWAGGCPPCRAEMPGFERVYQQHRDKVLLVGVDIGPFVGLGSHDDARKLLKELGVTYPTAFAKASSPVRDYGVQAMPTTVFLTADGKVFSKHTGFLTEQQLNEAVTRLLAAAP